MRSEDNNENFKIYHTLQVHALKVIVISLKLHTSYMVTNADNICLFFMIGATQRSDHFNTAHVSDHISISYSLDTSDSNDRLNKFKTQDCMSFP